MEDECKYGEQGGSIKAVFILPTEIIEDEKAKEIIFSDMDIFKKYAKCIFKSKKQQK